MTPAKIAKLYAQLEKAESELTRAMNKWMKVRAQVKRAGKKLDKEFAMRGTDIGGEHHLDEFAHATGIEKKPIPARKR